MHKDKKIGYVPKDAIQIDVKDFCKGEPLKIINIKMVHGNTSYGIRVIPKCFYEEESNKIFFCE